MDGAHSEATNRDWLSVASFGGLSDADIEQLILGHLTSEALLSDQDLAECKARIQHGTVAESALASHRLRNHLLPLALGIARKYPPLAQSMPNALDAIHVAIDKWDPTTGFSLGTYASWFIRQAVTRDRESQESETPNSFAGSR